MQVGAYETLAQLGAGGMSLVWLARGPSGLVVLKRQLNPSDDERLREEALVGMRLRHPGVVQTLDLLEHEGRPILVLEYVAGASLVALRNRGPLTPAAVCSVGADIAEALAALHGARGPDGRSMRVLHRDVSPANIIVTPEGQARLIDLGIARAPESVERTQTGDLRGTVRYLAPELFDARPHTALTDLWALGVCLFEAALGRQAVTGPEAVILATVVRGRLLELREGEELPLALDGAIHALCAPVEHRVASAVAASRILHAAGSALGDGRREASLAVRALVDTGATEPHAPAGPAAISDEQAFMRYAATTYCGTSDDEVLLTEPIDELAALDGAPTAVATPPMVAPVSTVVTPSASIPMPNAPPVRSLAGPSPTSRPYPLAPGPAMASSAGGGLAPAPVTAVSQPTAAAPGASPISVATEPLAPAARPSLGPILAPALIPTATTPSEAFIAEAVRSTPGAVEESRPFARSPTSSPGALEATEDSWDVPRPRTDSGEPGSQETSARSQALSPSLAVDTAPSAPALGDGLSSAEADELAELRGGSTSGFGIAAAVLAALAIVVVLALWFVR